MIICISPSDNFILSETAALANLYKEQWAVYDSHCLKGLGQDRRLTLIGHGNKHTLGEAQLTPEQLFADFVSFNLPRTVKVIDLVCCGVGEEVVKEDGTVESFVQRLKKLFVKHGRADVRINAFTNVNVNEPMSDINILTSTRASGFLSSSRMLGVGVAVEGLGPEAKKKYDREVKQCVIASDLQERAKQLLEEKLALRREIREIKLSVCPDRKKVRELEVKCHEISDLCDRYNKSYSSKRREFLLDVYYSLSKVIYTGDDIRSNLDNEIFQMSQQSLSALSTKQKSALVFLHKRIAELKDDLSAQKQESKPSYWGLPFNIFSSAPVPESDIPDQIKALEKFSVRIQQSKSDVEILTCLEEGVSNKKLMTPKNRVLAEQLLEMFSISKSFLNELQNQTLVI